MPNDPEPTLPITEPQDDRTMAYQSDAPSSKDPGLRQFIGTLVGSKLMTQQEVDEFQKSLADAEKPKSGEDLAKALYRAKKLTRFQTQAVFQGRTKGLVVGNYVVLDKIGQGGMGHVYKARHQRMKREVALKVLPSQISRHKEAVERFQREVVAAAKLNHPNIVTAYDADEADGVHFLVMELVEGIDLSKLVRTKGTLSVAKAVDYVTQAAQGLQYAHENGLIHRDIKPSNLLRDNSGTIKILDMGLARFERELHESTAAQSLTQSGQVMGTLDYMAPEQATDTHHADARSDIYSLGCTLYYLLTGQVVFEGQTMATKIIAHREQAIPSLRDQRSDVSEQLDRIFQQMLAKDPEDRQESMAAVVRQLESCERPAEAMADTATFSVGPTGGDSTATEGDPARDFTVAPPPPAPGSDSGSDSGSSEIDAWLNKELPETPTVFRRVAKARKKKVNPQWMIVGGATLGLTCVAILLGIVLRVKTPEGTIVVTVNQPDAVITVLSDEGRVEIEQRGGEEPVSIAAAPGRHQLRVEKPGFEAFTAKITLTSNGKESITAELVPKASAPQTMLVVVVAVPGAEIFVDGRKVVASTAGDTEPIEIPVKDGDHDLRIMKDGVELLAKTVAVAQGKIETVNVGHERWTKARDELVTMVRDGRRQLPREEWTDLLRFVDAGAIDSDGRVHFEGDDLILTNGRAKRAYLPIRMDGDYDFEVVFTRAEGSGPVYFRLPVGRHTCGVVLSDGSPPRSGFESLGNMHISEPGRAAVAKDGRLQNRHRYTAFAQVRSVSSNRVSIRLDLDGAQVLSWAGDPKELTSYHAYWQDYPHNRPMVGSWRNVLHCHGVRVRPVSGNAVWQSPADLPDSPCLATPTLGENDNNLVTRDFGPDGAHLIGFDLRANAAGLRCLGPIYRQNGNPTRSGQYPPGAEDLPGAGETKTVVAKEGYAVGGVVAQTANQVLYGMRVIFMRDLGDRLDPADRYESEWFGSQNRQLDMELITEGRPIVGTQIAWSDKRLPSGLGWLLARELPVADGEPRTAAGFVRVTELEPISAYTAFWPYAVNHRCESVVCWPVVSQDFQYSSEFIFSAAPSAVTYSIPPNVKSFSAIGHALSAPIYVFKVTVDGSELFASAPAGIVPILVDLPPGSERLKLSVDTARSGSNNSLWLSPKFHRKPVSEMRDFADDRESIPLTKFAPEAASVGSGRLEVNPAWGTKAPLVTESYRICPEFIEAHAYSRLTYAIPVGAREFSAIGYIGCGFFPSEPNVANVRFQVRIDEKLVYESPEAGTVPIQVAIPLGAKQLELIVDPAGEERSDHSYWCYPRFYWSPQPRQD